MSFTFQILLFSLLLLSNSHFDTAYKGVNNKAENSGFTLSGKVYGFKDSTLFYLDYSDAGISQDSVYVINEAFSIKGKYTDDVKAMRISLRTKDYSDYKFFWLEGEKISFSATKGGFLKAVISGSPAQEMDDKYYKWIHQEDEAIERLTLQIRKNSGKDSAKIQDSIQWLENRVFNELTPAFICNHPNSIISVYLLEFYQKRIGKIKTQELYSYLDSHLKETIYGRGIQRYLVLNKDVTVGNRFVDIEQENYKGVKTKLSDSKGKYVLLEFWSSFCGPCRRENPELVKIYNHFQPKGFEIYAVSVDQSRPMWLKAIEKDQLPWINVSELNGIKNSAVLTYGVYEYPTNYLIDREGVIIAKNLRGEHLRIKLNELLGE